MQRPVRHIGILAGGGSLPREIAEAAAAAGKAVHIVAIEGAADQDFSPFPVTWVNWGQIGGMIRALRRAGAEAMVIVGHVSRPDFGKIRTDLGFWMNLPRIFRMVFAGGDDSVLRSVVAFFESHGFTVLGPADVAPELIIGAGPMGKFTPRGDDDATIARGFSVISALGAFDVGQSVVISGGTVEAIEGAEGTDGMLKRLAEQRVGNLAASGGVLVKRTKPGQELRVDMPVIGPRTVIEVLQTGLRGIAVEADRVLAASRNVTIAEANRAGIFVVGRAPPPDGWDKPASRVSPRGGKGTPAAPQSRETDLERGTAVLAALRPYVASRAVVVVRRHVLAIESGEGIVPAIDRVSRLRQWGDGRARRRAGSVVLADAGDVDLAILEAAACSLLDRVAVAGGTFAAEKRDAIFAAARKLGLRISRLRDGTWESCA